MRRGENNEKNILFAFVLAAAFTSCSNNKELDQIGLANEINLTATLSDASSHTTFQDNTTTMKVVWSANDQIKVLNSSKGVSQNFSNSQQPTTTSGRFNGNLNVMVGEQLFAYYHANLTLNGAAATVDYSAQAGTLEYIQSNAVILLFYIAMSSLEIKIRSTYVIVKMERK